MNGLKNEENARQKVQNDLQTVKDKIRQLESGSGSGSTVGGDVSTSVGKGPSGTFARPPLGVAVQLNDLIYAEEDGIQRMGHRAQTMWLPRTHGHRGVEFHPGPASDGTRPTEKKMWIGIKQKHEQGTWPTKLWSICGSAMKRICQRCWTETEQNQEGAPQAARKSGLLQTGS